MLCVLLVVCFPLCGGNVLYDLYSHLLKDYKPYIRPRIDPQDTVDVAVTFTMMSVEGLYENTQTLVSSGYFHLTWTDDLLTWNPAAFSNITTLTLPWENVWSPDLCVYNSIEDISQLSFVGGHARVSSLGLVDWYVGTKEKTRCALDMTKFPFDSQICSLKLFQWSSFMNEVNITAQGIGINNVLFQANGEWEVEVASKETKPLITGNIHQSELIFTFRFHRKYLYYVITNILPVMLLSVLNLGVFFVPPESGEKISLCISIVLAYAVFLTVVSESLPEVSEPLCIFGVYLLIMMFLKVMTTLAIVAILKIYHSGNDKFPNETDDLDINKTLRCGSKVLCHPEENIKLATKINRICFVTCLILTLGITLVCFGLMLN